VGAILQDGTALWEELQPLEQLLSEYMDDEALGMEEVFAAEVLNDPSAKSGKLLNANLVKEWNPLEPQLHQGSFIIIDPATSKATPDQIVICYFEVYDLRAVAIEMQVGKFTGPETVHIAIDMGLRHNCQLIVPEGTAYQFVIGEWFNFICAQRGIEGFVVEMLYNSNSKNSRILRSFQAVMKGEVMFKKDIKALYINQAQQFRPHKTNNLDDILDAVEMGHRFVTTMPHLLVPQGWDILEGVHVGNGDWDDANSPCGF
jgi:hypothetical protein